jgi:hypothetical protein
MSFFITRKLLKKEKCTMAMAIEIVVVIVIEVAWQARLVVLVKIIIYC